jgi:hypothetical protein
MPPRPTVNPRAVSVAALLRLRREESEVWKPPSWTIPFKAFFVTPPATTQAALPLRSTCPVAISVELLVTRPPKLTSTSAEPLPKFWVPTSIAPVPSKVARLIETLPSKSAETGPAAELEPVAAS